jgi:riboflavin kinase/FMN adenylyltransferase
VGGRRLIEVRRLEELPALPERAALAVGTFDGVHRGHRALLARVREVAREAGLRPAALTFTNHPLTVLNPGAAPGLLTAYPLKRRLLAAEGLALLVAVEFTPALAETAAEDFVRKVLLDRLRAGAILVGFDFAFGRGRAGTPALLQALGREWGFLVEVLPPVLADGRPIKSSRVRALVAEGRPREAGRLLGRPYGVAGRPQAGAARGRQLGFPTANLDAAGLLLPDGVYAGWAEVGAGLYEAVMNVGTAPTFGGGARRVEAHLLDFAGDLSGVEVTVWFLERLRDERRFPGAAALREQIEADVARARALLGEAAGEREGLRALQG